MVLTELYQTNEKTPSQQLYEAYMASLSQKESEEGKQTTTSLSPNCTKDTITEKRDGCDVSGPMILESHVPDPNNDDVASDDGVADMKPTALSEYQLDTSTVEAWNQLGDLVNELGHSVIVRQAEMINCLARKGSQNHKEEKMEQKIEDSHGTAKKRKFADANGVNDAICKDPKRVVVSSSSEEEDSDCSTYDEETVAVSSLSSSSRVTDDAGIFEQQVERMIRMTTYAVEMERLHSLFRLEMEAMTGNSEDSSFL